MQLTKYILMLIVMISLSTLVHAANPFTQVSSSSMQIDYPKIENIKVGSAHVFQAHVINLTSVKTNKTTSCSFHLYDSTGDDTNPNSTAMYFDPQHNIDFQINLSGYYFSKLGEYDYIIQCNSSNEAAFASNGITVTSSGEDISAYNSLIIPSILFLIATLFMVAGMMYDNKRWLIKTALFIASLLFIVMLLNLMLDIAITAKEVSMVFYAFVAAIIITVFIFIAMIVYYLKAIVNSFQRNKEEELM